MWEFFSERIEFEKWEEGGRFRVQVDVEPEAPVPKSAGRVIGRG